MDEKEQVKWSLKELLIKDLKEHSKNPRQIGKEQFERLGNLIGKFGLIDKPIINQDMTIIGGHQRIKYFKKKKIKKIECWVSDRQLSEEHIDELCIGLNLHQGSWDYEIMANQWEPLDLLKYGFTEEQLMGASKEAENIEEILSNDEPEEDISVGKDEESITQLGDLYVLGNHRLICGDSTDPDVVTRVLDGQEPILMVTDPPYGVNYDPTWRNNIKSEGKFKSAIKMNGKVLNDDQADWRITYSLFKGSVAYVWHGGKHSGTVAKNLEDCEFEIVSQIIWNKQQFAFARGDYHWKHEPCYYAVRKGHKHNWQGDRKQCTVWDISNLNPAGRKKENDQDDKVEGHGTQKPLECMGKPIQNNTEKGDWVYDPFLGSGTTLIAAERLARKCIGMEISTAYCDMIVKRYINFMAKKGENAIIYKNGEIISHKDFINNGNIIDQQ